MNFIRFIQACSGMRNSDIILHVHIGFVQWLWSLSARVLMHVHPLTAVALNCRSLVSLSTSGCQRACESRYFIPIRYFGLKLFHVAGLYRSPLIERLCSNDLANPIRPEGRARAITATRRGGLGLHLAPSRGTEVPAVLPDGDRARPLQPCPRSTKSPPPGPRPPRHRARSLRP